MLAKVEGSGAGEDDRRIRRVFPSQFVGVKHNLHRNCLVTFPKATGRRTHALEIVLEYAIMEVNEGVRSE